MWRGDIQRRMAEALRREDQAWAGVRSVADWERFRDRRIGALRSSLGPLPTAAGPQPSRVTGTVAGKGYLIRKLIYETQPGVVVAALLYLPEAPGKAMPAIQLVHAHHRPKDQAELQDMGVNWARAGSAVLVPDLVGHGERREDPFGGRQGYYSRYYSAMQLGLVGESLAGWMVWDLLRGNDVLLGTPGVDPERLILIGAVAGGGDLAAVAAALDPRVRCVVPFNFGAGGAWRQDLGPAAPPGVNLAGWGYWETTRNLGLSARDGFLPWVIVAAAAPRHLVYAHEFAWDPEADPAWERIRRVYELYGVPERLGSMKGAGRCAPGAGNTHCTNVGPVHRAGFYPWLEQWFGMRPPLPETGDRRPAEALQCRDGEAAGRAVPLREVAAGKAAAILASVRGDLAGRPPAERRARLRALWSSLLGETGPAGSSVGQVRPVGPVGPAGAHRAERVLLETDPGIAVPVLLLLPGAGRQRPFGNAQGLERAKRVERPPVVIGIAQHGKGLFLERAAPELARLLEAGVAVCLPDVRGTGETRPDEMHGLESEYINCSEDERVLGRSALGLQLRDLRAVLRYLETRPDLDAARLALWGDSFAPFNPPKALAEEHDSRRVDNPLRPNLPCGPAIAEPAGPMLALLAGLFEDAVGAVLVRRGLVGLTAAFGSFFLQVPSDVVVPGALRAGDLCDLAAALAPRPLRIESPVDALGRLVEAAELPRWFEPVVRAYSAAPGNFAASAQLGDDAAEWLAGSLLAR